MSQLNTPPAGVVTTAPVPTAGSGAFTTVAATLAYTKKNKEVTWNATITITTNGTAAVSVLLPLPFANGPQNASGNGFSSTAGTGLAVQIAAGASNALIVTAPGAYPGANGAVLIAGGTYFTA